MRFEGYECYKDSGIEWLDTIPTEWEMRRIKEIFSIAEGQVNPLVEPYKSMILIAPNHIEKNTGKIIYTEISSEQGAISGKYYVHSGELIYSKIRPALNKICKIDFDCLCSADMYPLKVNNQSNNSYYMQVFLCIDFVNYVSADSSRVAMPKVNRDSLRLYRFPFPPLKTQQKIATYLDTQTQKIEKEINLLKEKIEKYKELKQTLINETVLRGLDKGVELKDSGIEWIGEIPKNWEIKRLKELVKNILSGGTPTSNNEVYWTNGTINWCNIKDMGRDKLLTKTERKITQSAFISKNLKLIPKETILYSIYATLGRVNITKIETTINQAILAIFENKKKINKIYFIYYLEFIEKNIQLFANFNTQYNLNADIVKRLNIVVPPLKEQTQIANYLDEKTQKIDNITQTISKKIELLKEFRKTLVNDVVTGRVKV